jgi:hypothetical protein
MVEVEDIMVATIMVDGVAAVDGVGHGLTGPGGHGAMTALYPGAHIPMRPVM